VACNVYNKNYIRTTALLSHSLRTICCLLTRSRAHHNLSQ